ncbi:MAG: hypothetical protein F4Z01_03615 [Gammaproteobacteria bacterium]|nr:hypothetical protein [Gammaproteobacteria bacterium]MYF39172.1 hypothetical protein [Gammaproteobacteria bacterium]
MFIDSGSNSDAPNVRPGSEQQGENSAPMMAVFGGMFALMLVFLLVVNVVSQAAVRERLKEATEEGTFRIEREDGSSGYSIIVFPESLRIVETAEGVDRGSICDIGNAYRNYAERVYNQQGDQLLFFITEGSVPTMAEARNCLRSMWPDRTISIGWVITDNEFLKSVMLDEIPEYIKEHVDDTL